MARPAIFPEKVIDFIHEARGPFSLSDIRRGCGIKDPKTVRRIIDKLVVLRFMAYNSNPLYGKKWRITTKWPSPYSTCDVVKGELLTMTLVERGAKALRRK